MEHDIPLITTISVGFSTAFILGFIAKRFKVPALVGYLFAGIIIGPVTPGFVADASSAAQLSEIGVMLLMFGVGLHFSIGDLLQVKRIAIPGAVLQMALATFMGMGLGFWWGWSTGASLIFGVSLSCASTVVLIKALDSIGSLESMDGRIAVGWLVMEDLLTVMILVLMPPLAGILGGTLPASSNTDLWWPIGKTLLLVSTFVFIMYFAGRRGLPWLMLHVARTGSGELFTLLVFSAAFGIAYGAAQIFGVSFALGAFFAGTVMRGSEFSHRAAEESLPLRDAFSVLFFVSVGMLFEPAILLTKPIHVLGIVLVIVFGKFLVALILVLILRYPLITGLTVAASLAQIGEFSFILVGLGLTLRILEQEGQSLILAGALISITLNPLLFRGITPLHSWMLKHSALIRRLEERKDLYIALPTYVEKKYLEGQVIIIGYGRIGQYIGAILHKQGVPYVIVEQNREHVEEIRKQGELIVSGDATDAATLAQVHIANAAMLVITPFNLVKIQKITKVARNLNPKIEIVLRTRNHEESMLFNEGDIDVTIFSEEDLLKNMAAYVSQRFAPQS